MKKLLLVMIILFTSFLTLLAEERIWSNSSAEVINKGDWEIGIFNSLKYGLTETIQLEAAPLTFFVMPNFKLRKEWKSDSIFIFSTEHSIVYPTLFLNTISTEGTGGILPPSTVFPNFTLFNNSAYISLGEKTKFTTYVGLSVNIGSIDESNPTIDYPLIYPRLSAYYNRYSGYYGIAVTNQVNSFKFDISFKMFILPDIDSDNVDLSQLEQKTVVSYQLKRAILFDVGYLISTGYYPYGRDTKIFPLADVRFQF